MTFVCGIDEAGRGPVIGPLVMCGLSIKESDIQKLIDLDVKDSKLLTPNRRVFLFSKLQEFKHKVIVVSPQEIDNALIDPSLNLNWVEAIASAKIINELKPKE